MGTAPQAVPHEGRNSAIPICNFQVATVGPQRNRKGWKSAKGSHSNVQEQIENLLVAVKTQLRTMKPPLPRPGPAIEPQKPQSAVTALPKPQRRQDESDTIAPIGAGLRGECLLCPRITMVARQADGHRGNREPSPFNFLAQCRCDVQNEYGSCPQGLVTLPIPAVPAIRVQTRNDRQQLRKSLTPRLSGSMPHYGQPVNERPAGRTTIARAIRAAFTAPQKS